MLSTVTIILIFFIYYLIFFFNKEINNICKALFL